MGMVKRRVSSKAKVDIEKFEALKQGFLLDIKNVVNLEEISHDLIINWDQLYPCRFLDNGEIGGSKSRTCWQR